MTQAKRDFGFSIDRGGTFTDVYATVPGPKKFRLLKLLSEDPDNYPDAPREGIRRILEAIVLPLPSMQGFRDLLLIGNQSRRHIFDLVIARPELLYEEVVEVDERVVLIKTVGVTGERVRVLRRPDVAALREQLSAVLARGVSSLAVVFLHSYTYAAHERAVGDLARDMGFAHVSLSSEVMPMVKAVPRGYTTAADAYLTPIITQYLASFRAGFDAGFDDIQTLFMQSDGGLTPMSQFRGSRAILSGPAGGVVGYAATAFDASGRRHGQPQPVIGLDMGGTSSDVSRYAGTYEHVFETVTAGITLQSPQLDINTVAAGGGSRLFYRGGLFSVGPESAGAHPGPICYRKGGYLAVTDANVFLGRIIPKYFPHIFGPREDQALDAEGPGAAFAALAAEVQGTSASAAAAAMAPEEVAHGFLRVAIEAMCRPIRNLTTMKGYDITTHALACFGGAGPQFCCAIAQSLGVSTIKVHRMSGVLSAYGLSLADVVAEQQEGTYAALQERLKRLDDRATNDLLKQGFDLEHIQHHHYLNLRFSGTDTSLMSEASAPDGFLRAFLAQYQREFGFLLEGRDVLVDDARVRAVGTRAPAERPKRSTPLSPGIRAIPRASLTRMVPQLQDVSTVVIEPACEAAITPEGDITVAVGQGRGRGAGLKAGGPPDPIYLSIFAHRFMGIAEQMGRTLQRTSISVNIKERLDFSCALFDAAGGLVANAPHLPVHLGAMQEAVKYQVKHWGADGLRFGDVLVSNHPQLAGGSHLPDITVITPVFVDNGAKPSFFVASRGHHADVGGIAPGSMPPLSKSLAEEGAAIVAFKLVEGGVFNEQGISKLLEGTRNLADNLSDLRAQVAANTRGTKLMQDLTDEYGLDVIQAYMGHIQDNAERAVRDMLVAFSLSQGLPEVGTVTAEDFLDDGTRIALAVTIDRKTCSATFDFTGTGPEVYGNLNAPPAVTASAVIYSLRCLVPDVDIPLNQGCLTPVNIIIPQGSLLSPCAEAAVVGGNVLTSQRVTDVILKAFRACAASQGCMNNLTLGDATMGYYETIAGGAGAGPGWHGCSGVHTHMTNTRITDPEILERRYPLLLLKFALRPDSGGTGQYKGGDGVERELMFRKDLVVSILSERRAFQPYGLSGGGPGARGKNLLRYRTGRVISLGGKNTISVKEGDRLTILTPGGGGYGSPDSPDVEAVATKLAAAAPVEHSAGSVLLYQLAQEQA
ncbi:Hydantoinase B/oxoprolinase-domain-containing protein [Tribonema minus]|uniref:Hydantoinase B/oxoprolinase-domain-containing protein n=1 Tax=Tribonema minus TaxID=303371 RepID=A0A835ZBL8_9STRA|nr:Hydantoinase B/oxoprolinase-domain-containing protein [Tribonema minus]